MIDPELETFDLPPTQALILEVLAARYRLGESFWPFPARCRPALEALRGRGLLDYRPGNAAPPLNLLAALTDEGVTVTLGGTYKSPATALLEEALHLRVNGERAPGGNETWHDWDDKAERFLRSLLPEPDAAP